MIACPCCAGREARLAFSAGDRLFGTTAKRFDLYECPNCEVVFLWPVPTEAELAGYYPRGYWWQTAARPIHPGRWHGLLEAYRRFMVRGQVRRAERLAAATGRSPVRILDVGCGDGLFLSGCGERSWVRLGLDLSLDALGSAQVRGGIHVVQSRVDVLPLASDSVDVITMFHVLEHLAHPRECLREIRRVLATGGRFVVQVPNAGSLQRYLLGRRWAGFDVPRHLVNYSADSLRDLLEQEGFHVATTSHFSLRDNPAIPVMSVFPRLYPPARRLAVTSGSSNPWANAAADLAYFALVLLATPLALAEGLASRGGTILAEAQKRD